jgi:predicted permease
MELFSLLFFKLLPLYGTIALGYIARKYLDVERQTLSRILLYLVVPFIFFNGAMHTPVSLGLLCMPLIVAAVSSALCLLFYRIGGRYWQDSTRNLLALMAGDANTGYFGLPVAMLLFDATGVGIYLSIIIGVLLYENTLGFFITARGRHTVGEAIAKLLRLPTLYAFGLGLLLHGCGLNLPDATSDFFSAMRGAYLIMGMMVIGIALAEVAIHHIDWTFIGFAFLAKFGCYPLAVFLLVQCDLHALHWFDPQIHEAFLLMSLMPLATNSVIFATLLDAQPEKAASSVFISVLFAMAYVPFMAAWLVK